MQRSFLGTEAPSEYSKLDDDADSTVIDINPIPKKNGVQTKAIIAKMKSSVTCKKRFKQCSKRGWPIGIATFLTGMIVLAKPVVDYYYSIMNNIKENESIRDEILHLYQSRSLNASFLNITCPAPQDVFWNHPEWDYYIHSCDESGPCPKHAFRIMSDYCDEITRDGVQSIMALIDQACKNLFEDFCKYFSIINGKEDEKVGAFFLYGFVALASLMILSYIVPRLTQYCANRTELSEEEEKGLATLHLTYDPSHPETTELLLREREDYENFKEALLKILNKESPFPTVIQEIIVSYTPYHLSAHRMGFLIANRGLFRAASTMEKPLPNMVVEDIFQLAAM